MTLIVIIVVVVLVVVVIALLLVARRRQKAATDPPAGRSPAMTNPAWGQWSLQDRPAPAAHQGVAGVEYDTPTIGALCADGTTYASTTTSVPTDYSTPQTVGYTVPAAVSAGMGAVDGGAQPEYAAFSPGGGPTGADAMYAGFAVAPAVRGAVAGPAAAGEPEYVYEVRFPDGNPGEADAGASLPVYATADEAGAANVPSGPLYADGRQTVLGTRAAVDAWIAYGADRHDAETALKSADYELGAFCIRPGSAARAPFVLSVVGPQGAPRHYRITRTEDGSLQLSDASGVGAPTFANVYELVAHYSSHPVSKLIPRLVGCIPVPMELPDGAVDREDLYVFQPPRHESVQC